MAEEEVYHYHPPFFIVAARIPWLKGGSGRVFYCDACIMHVHHIRGMDLSDFPKNFTSTHSRVG